MFIIAGIIVALIVWYVIALRRECRAMEERDKRENPKGHEVLQKYWERQKNLSYRDRHMKRNR